VLYACCSAWAKGLLAPFWRSACHVRLLMDLSLLSDVFPIYKFTIHKNDRKYNIFKTTPIFTLLSQWNVSIIKEEKF
jgi:hypothetical protein